MLLSLLRVLSVWFLRRGDRLFINLLGHCLDQSLGPTDSERGLGISQLNENAEQFKCKSRNMHQSPL